MQSLTNPVHSLPHVLLNYLATGFGKPEVPAMVSGAGMPADTVLFDEQSAILSFTCVAAPMFRTKIERLATAQSIDVMLVRCCLTGGDLLPVSVDVVLAGGGLPRSSWRSLRSIVTMTAACGWCRSGSVPRSGWRRTAWS
jgi:hypothetical protein